MSMAVPMTMPTMMRSVVIMMVVMIVVCVFLVMVMMIVFFVVVMVIHVMGMVSVAVPVAASIHFLQQTHGIQKGNAKTKKDELGQSEFQRGFFVQNVWKDIDRCQIHKTSGGNQYQRIAGHFLGQQTDRCPNHGGKGRPELRHDGVGLAKTTLYQNGKVSQLVGNLVKQN